MDRLRLPVPVLLAYILGQTGKIRPKRPDFSSLAEIIYSLEYYTWEPLCHKLHGDRIAEADDGVDIDVVVSQSNLLSDTFSMSPQKVTAVKMF